MGLPAGYRRRAATGDDLEAVAELLVADELRTIGQVVLGEDFLRDEWSRPGFDPTTDAWLVVDEAGAVVGFAQTFREEPEVLESWGLVHPDHRGRGIGSALLDVVEERTNGLTDEIPSLRLRTAIDAGDDAARAMLRARGLRPVRHFWHMQIDVTELFEPGSSPDGIAITQVEAPRDLPVVHAVLDHAFSEHWGYRPEPFDRWIEEQTGSPSYDPSLWLLAREGDEPVAVLTASLWGDRGWVNEVGVLVSHRGRGVGASLLRRAFSTFAARGVHRIILNVDSENATGATALYERVGMQILRRWDLWERSAGARRRGKS